MCFLMHKNATACNRFIINRYNVDPICFRRLEVSVSAIEASGEWSEDNLILHQ